MKLVSFIRSWIKIMKQNWAGFQEDCQPVILSSSLTSVAVRPSLQCALTDDNTRRNIRAGMNWTSAISTTPVSRNWFESAKQGVTIEQHETPLLFAHPLHHALRLPRALRAVRDHRVRANADRTPWWENIPQKTLTSFRAFVSSTCTVVVRSAHPLVCL